MTKETTAQKLDEVWDDWNDLVTMTASQLRDWLDTDESKSVGDTGGADSTGRTSGHRIIEIHGTRKGDLTESQVEWMTKTVGYIKRHRAQRPSGDVTETKWRYSLMNWGHDPLA